MNHSIAAFVACALGSGLMGCNSGQGSRGEPGEPGWSQFTVLCEWSDCNSNAPFPRTPLPLEVPVTAELTGLDPPAMRVGLGMASAEGGLITFKKPGYVALLAFDYNGHVDDLVHVHVRPIETVAVVGPTTLPVGQTARMTALVLNPLGQPMGGSVAWKWDIADPDIASIAAGAQHSLFSDAAKVVGLKPGSTKVHASVGGRTAEMSVVVEASP